MHATSTKQHLVLLLVLVWSSMGLQKVAGSSGVAFDDACLHQVHTGMCAASYENFLLSVAQCASATADAEADNRITVLAPEEVRPVWPGLLATFKAKTGMDVSVEFRALADLDADLMDSSATGRNVYDGWLIGSMATVDLAMENRLQPLDSYISADKEIEWLSVHRLFRGSSCVYNGSVIGITVTGKVSVLYYRTDVLNVAKLPPPSTWDELLSMAKVLNGSDFNRDGKKDYALCFQIRNGCLEDQITLSQILASMTQSKGTQTGWLFDTDTLDHFVDTEAMSKALSILSELNKYMWPDDTCDAVNMRFLRGECAFTWKWDQQFKGMQLFDKLRNLTYNPWRGGAIGYAAMPGSLQVLDRMTGKLVPCANSTVCPFATYENHFFTGKPQLVNRAPFSGFSSLSGMVNKNSPPRKKAFTYQLFAMASSLPISYPWVIAPTAAGPFREQHMSMSNESLELWRKGGYDTSDVKRYLKTMKTAMDSPNFALDLRITQGVNFHMALKRASSSISLQRNPEAVQKQLVSDFQSILATTPREKLADGYWASYNMNRRYRTYPAQDPTPNLEISSSTLSYGAIIGIAVCSLPCLLSVVAVAWFARRRQSGFLGLLFGSRYGPGCGEETTILITDIEGSTWLWEQLSSDVMNRAIELHGLLIRHLLHKHHGYESAVEGDSFIVSFFKPIDAMRFALHLQHDLLLQPWPQELLDCHLAQVVWAKAKHSLETPFFSKERTRGSDAHESGDIRSWFSVRGKSFFTAKPQLRNNSGSCKSFDEHNQWVVSAYNTSSKVDVVRLELMGGGSAMSALSGMSYIAAHPVLENMAAEGSTMGRNSQPFLQCLKSHWEFTVIPPADPSAWQVVHRGLRVRVGMHTGVFEPDDAVMNKTSNRMQYGGTPLSTARNVSDMANGGMVLISDAAYQHLPVNKLEEELLVNLGTFEKNGIAYVVYQAVAQQAISRLAYIPCELRVSKVLQTGLLQAPTGHVSIVFTHLIGAKTLLAWNKELGQNAINLYQRYASDSLLDADLTAVSAQQTSGYMLELAEGLCLTAWHNPACAVIWGLKLTQNLLEADWQPDLLCHELCEQVTIRTAAPEPERTSDMLISRSLANARIKESIHDRDAAAFRTLFRGPRIKMGIDSGQVVAAVNPVTGRMTYRGRVMNRAARVAEKAGSNQLWCSEKTWHACVADPDSDELICAQGVQAQPVGSFVLKGVSEAMNLFQCICQDTLDTPDAIVRQPVSKPLPKLAVEQVHSTQHPSSPFMITQAADPLARSSSSSLATASPPPRPASDKPGWHQRERMRRPSIVSVADPTSLLRGHPSCGALDSLMMRTSPNMPAFTGLMTSAADLRGAGRIVPTHNLVPSELPTLHPSHPPSEEPHGLGKVPERF